MNRAIMMLTYSLQTAQVRQHAAELLERVQLQAAANLRSSAYSGGMKRRLSVSLALLGNPRVLYLDEPTTGKTGKTLSWRWSFQAIMPDCCNDWEILVIVL